MHALRELPAAQLAHVAVVQAERVQLAHVSAQPLRLRRVQRDRQVAALDEVRVDLLPREHARDLVDRVEHLALQREEPGPIRARRPGEEARGPAAVAAGGAEAGALCLEHDDAQRRLGSLEVVGSPQARVAGADDRHVGLERAGQLLAPTRRPSERAPPEAELARAHGPRLVARRGGRARAGAQADGASSSASLLRRKLRSESACTSSSARS